MHAPEIDGKVFVNDYPREAAKPRHEGQFYRCRITAAHDYDLVAEISKCQRSEVTISQR